MLKLSHSKLILISGMLWLCVGLSLLPLGLTLIIEGETRPLVHYSSSIFGGFDEAAIALIVAALFVGYMKGKYVLGKSSNRIVGRIRAASDPASLATVFTPAYCVLIGSMMLLGMGIKYFGIPSDVRGMVDVAVGSAMISGATITFRHLW